MRPPQLILSILGVLVAGCGGEPFDVSPVQAESDAGADAPSPDTAGPSGDSGSGPALDAATTNDSGSVTDAAPEAPPPGCKPGIPVLACPTGTSEAVFVQPGSGPGLPLLDDKTGHRLRFRLTSAGRLDQVTVRFLSRTAATAFGGFEGVLRAELFYIPCADGSQPWVPLGTVEVSGGVASEAATFPIAAAAALPASAEVAIILTTNSKQSVWELRSSVPPAGPPSSPSTTWAYRTGPTTTWADVPRLGDVTVSAKNCGP